MGTDPASVTIRAASLAGASKNQDRYAWGDGWAFVLDGASAFTTAHPQHDGGWYAERLRSSLARGLRYTSEEATSAVVARAILAAASAHEDPRTCPNSTIALARWNDKKVELYVLGDSTAALVAQGKEFVLSDSRMANVAQDLRREYRERLREGHGFDVRHREILRAIQTRQATARNQPCGYWIAGADPNAAFQAISRTFCAHETSTITLATDGGANLLEYGLLNSWSETKAIDDLHEALVNLRSVEARDLNGAAHPRSKPHDDATILEATLNQANEGT